MIKDNWLEYLNNNDNDLDFNNDTSKVQNEVYLILNGINTSITFIKNIT